MSARVVTGSRLHFGLLNPSATPLPRLFGGVGMMVADPPLTVSVARAREWSAAGPLALRALNIARNLQSPPFPCLVTVEKAPPEHAGLGSGTQLSLAVATACNRLWRRNAAPLAMARATGRGRRSAIGIHGFAQGGFLLEGGNLNKEAAPLLARYEFPPDWRVVLAIPEGRPGPTGAAEQGLIEALPPNEALTAALCRVLLMGLLPALVLKDLPAFGEALGEYNARAGELFAPSQGGTYASAAVAELVAFLTMRGVSGVGQSSWGPCVFAVADADRASWLVERLAGRAHAWATAGRNAPAEITITEEE